MNHLAVCFRLMSLTAIAFAGALPVFVADGQDNRGRYATSDSRSDYVHRIRLFDKMNTRILPGEDAKPYSPRRTCGRCHDYAHIASGFHFNPDEGVQAHGRRGETWIWHDETTGTQIPLSFRDWANTFSPDELGISKWEFVRKFGGRTPGGYPGLAIDRQSAGEEAERDPENGADRTQISGSLDVDCMICHSRGSVFDIESWSKQIDEENFEWASTAAIGLARIAGNVRRLNDDFDVEATRSDGYTGPRLPTTEYDASRFDAEGNVFFDIVRKPVNNSCYRCHTTLAVGPSASSRWNHDEDVHIRAGMSCVDCHRNDIGHNIVRGFAEEVHPLGSESATLSCYGCHMESETKGFDYPSGGGRMGAPIPQHKGLPPVHLERLSCTTCHAGPIINEESEWVQTAIAHRLGNKNHRHPDQQPRIVQPVLMPNEDNVLYPHRMMWPSYWGLKADGEITPLNPDDVNDLLRSTLKVRGEFLEEITRIRLSRAQRAEVLGEDRASVREPELTDDERQLLAEFTTAEGLKQFNERMESALLKLREEGHANPVYVCGEKLYQLNNEDRLEVVENQQARPYSWPIAHDVRPARWALGSNGCKDCHSDNSPFFYATVVTQSTTPGESSTSAPMHEYANLDANRLGTWNRAFQGRTTFKWTAIVSVVSVISILCAMVIYFVAAIPKKTRRGG